MLLFAGLAGGAIERAVTYAKIAEERGFRNFLVTEAASDAVSERMAEECAVMGTPQECHKKVEEFEKAGASYVILYPMATDGDFDRGVRAALDAFAQ
jgi:SpoU rRNA methylase family enzyme